MKFKDRISFFARRSRHITDVRIGFVVHTDRMNVVSEDSIDDEAPSTFNFGINLCLIWLNVGVTIYL